MAEWSIFHNPRCSKSRGALAILEEHNITPNVINYLDTPPSAETLAHLCSLLGCTIHDIIRTKEAEYKEHIAGKNLSDEQVIAVVVAYPKLLERPIVVHGEQAVIARPSEKVNELLG